MKWAPGMLNTCPNTENGASAQIFLALLNTLISAKCKLGPEGRYPRNYGPSLKDGDEFDFIIVGGGSAGCVVANRLSEVSSWKVLLLEAGDYPSSTTEIPGLRSTLQGTEEDWQYETEPSTTCCLSLTRKRCPCPRGKGLGGSSLLNTMLYTRATRHDHERWYNAGNTGWDYNSVTEYYQKHENTHEEDYTSYGKRGELNLTRYTLADPICQTLGDAFQELGFDKYTDDKTIGFKDNLMTIYDGARMSTSKAFLAPIKDRQNLFVGVNAYVTQLIVDRDALSVKGVQVKIGDNSTISLRAKNEVIVSAGSINTPSILMHSGIGLREHLSSLGIDTFKNLRVGENMQDHIGIGIFVALNSTNPVSNPLDDLYEYLTTRQGQLSKSGITNFLAYINTNNDTNESNVQFFHMLAPKNNQPALEAYIRSRRPPESVSKQLRELAQNFSLLVFLPIVLRPKSRGSILLQNSDPFSKPLIIPNYLSDQHEDDVKVLLGAVRFIQKLVKTNAFSHYDPKLVQLDVVACESYKPDSDEYWKCVFRHLGMTTYHPVGTCKMGPVSDTGAVVNPRLQVHGVKNIRVIDGSIMPFHTSSNPNAPIIMIGEKGATFIKEDWLNSILS